MSAPRMLLVSFLNDQACTSSTTSAAMEAPCQASVITAQVMLISKLTLQGSAGWALFGRMGLVHVMSSRSAVGYCRIIVVVWQTFVVLALFMSQT